MRVLHVVWEYPPVIYGGLARAAENLARAQVSAGSRVGVVTAAEDVTSPRRHVRSGVQIMDGVDVLRVRRPAPRTPWTDLLGAADEIDEAFAAAATGHFGPPDVVHGHDWIGARAAAAIARRTGARLVLTIHATEHGRRQGAMDPVVDGVPDRGPARVLEREREAVAAAETVVVCSQAMRHEVIDVLHADPAKVRVVPNAVDAAAWRSDPGAVAASRARWLGGAAGPLLVAAGRLEWEKGFSTLVRALPDLLAAHSGLRVVMAGRGSYSPDLQALAASLGVTAHLDLPGWLERRDLAALYAAADLVVVPSKYEPSGLVAREAQAAGATVIATRTGGLTEAVTDGVTGALIDVGDVHALRDTVNHLLAAPHQARALAQAGTAAVQALTWADVAHQTLTAYDRLPAHA